jgi:hypothetical protein
VSYYLVASVLLTLAVAAYVLFIRPADVPAPEAPSPVKHLDGRKAIIYENLRDLSFEYRLGKLSPEDYQKSKAGLQAELAQVMAERDRILQGQPAAGGTGYSLSTSAPAKPDADPLVCPHCNARFDRPLKFCGECGKPMRKEGKA